MREVLKTSISKYGPKTNAAITVENVQGKGLQLAIIYAGRKYYLPLSSVPLNPDEHANHPNHQKIKVDHNGKVGIGDPDPSARFTVGGSMILTTGDGSDRQIAYQDTRDSYAMAKIHFSDGGQINWYNGDGSGSYTIKAKIVVGGDFYTNDGSVSSLASDVRVKKDIENIDEGLDVINKLRPVSFKFNGKDEFHEDTERVWKGFIADEVQEVAPFYVNEEKGKIDGNEVSDFKTLSTTRMIPMMVKSIQELSAKVTALESK
jgi:hypothetical protein